ncbi:magnesium and cobalt transport protein CorA [Nocardiopsis sp. JB363]|uniref:magnesium and cobalt transport protein CorA n=1 Tax=Nocardiopsis sp. JB363 TaxID=1434837 RepID=UPI00097A9764|nr:magnesium and cobalt transport protein CorA [Nocardiopsis sp. JB363]SIO90241.1 Magnesium and cobalt transport protein CorA [Nocardiopsis sp. JB363]
MTESAPERTMALGREGAALPVDAPPGERRIVLYREGASSRVVDTFAEVDEANTADPASVAWIALTEPNREQVEEIARHFDLPHLAVEDAIVAHQRPKIEAYGDTLFAALRPAVYDEDEERLRVGETHVFATHRLVVTLRNGVGPDFEGIRARLDEHANLRDQGALGVVYAVLDRVVDDYAPTVAGLQEDVDEVENQVFNEEKSVSRRIYGLIREVIMLQRAVDPLGEVLDGLAARWERVVGEPRGGLSEYLRDVADHVASIRERVDGFRQLLQNIMAVEGSLVDQAQNEVMRKVSSWGGILVVPTLISSVYGMNIAPQPGFHWLFTWPITLAGMALLSVVLYLLFKRNGWL